MSLSTSDWVRAGVCVVAALVLLYLARVNVLLSDIPAEVRKLSGSRWTAQQLKSTYRQLQERPIDYQSQLPPRLERRYIVTGGNGERRTDTTALPFSRPSTTNDAVNQVSSAASSSCSSSPGARRRPTSGSSTSGRRSAPT